MSCPEDDFDADAEAAWVAEIERRLALIESGDYEAIDWREALAQMQQALKERRSLTAG
jgi:hypothetical protein